MPPPLPQPQAVLDYASPRQRGNLRLASQSVLAVAQDRGGVAVVETLSGKGEAFVALFSAACMFVLMLTVFFTQFDPTSARGRADMALPATLVGLVLAGGVTVMLLVINNTWRRTVLRVHADEVALEFASPFGRRRYRWGAEQVEDVRVERTSEAAHTLLAELQLHPAAAPIVHLFTDHPERELAPLGDAVRATLGFGPRAAGAAAAAAATSASAPTPTPGAPSLD